MKIESPRASLDFNRNIAPENFDFWNAGNRCLQNARYQLRTLWLFTYSDLKTILIPSLFFASITTLSGPGLTTTPYRPALCSLLIRVPHMVVWLWLTLLLVDISNQRHTKSILEDRINKPWRPLPAGRLSASDARRLLFAGIPFVLITTMVFLPQGFPITVIAIIGSHFYNDLGGADENILVRNLMNAAAITCFGAGAARVALGKEIGLNNDAYKWLGIIAAIVTTTMQVQDMEDQEGDLARGRVTIPLLIGDVLARYTIAISISIWSVLCPFYWDVITSGYILPGFVGFTIAMRTLKIRTLQADKLNWKAWNVWIMILYLLPIWNMTATFVKECFRDVCDSMFHF
ncbi:hypothetical protein ACLMJK_003866 [Lecanora helva]